MTDLAGTSVLEHVVRRAGLAFALTDLATGAVVTGPVTIEVWPPGHPERAVRTSTVTEAGVAGFRTLPGLRRYEDGSTGRDDWFASPLAFPPLPFVVRIVPDRRHLPVVLEVSAPVNAPIPVALPRSTAAPAPSGWMTATADVIDDTGAPAGWAVVELTVGSLLTGAITDTRGAVTIPVPRAEPPSASGTPASGPFWAVGIQVRCQPTHLERAPDTGADDPPTMPSILTQDAATIDTPAGPVAMLHAQLTTGQPLVLTSRPPPNRSAITITPAA